MQESRFQSCRQKSIVVVLWWNSYKRKNSDIDQHIMTNHPTITLTLDTHSTSFRATPLKCYSTIKADGKHKKVTTRVLSINRFTIFIPKCSWAHSNFSMELQSSLSKKFEQITKANRITKKLLKALSGSKLQWGCDPNEDYNWFVEYEEYKKSMQPLKKLLTTMVPHQPCYC